MSTSKTDVMKDSSEKKIVVIGAGLGGLSAAIHLRLAGREVVLYEATERVGGRANLIERSGFRFDTGPSLLNYPWVFEQMFAAAGRNFSDYVELLPVDPSIMFRWPDDERLTLSSDLAAFVRECERVEPHSAPRLFAFMREAEKKYRIAFEKLVNRNVDHPLKWISALSPRELAATGLWRSLDRELGRHFKSRYLREALGSYAMYLGGSPYDLSGMFTILAYGEMAQGLWLPKGGVYGLVEGIERLARELGVEIQTNSRVRRIRTRAERIKGVEMVDGSFHPASVVVSNVDLPTTDAELVETEKQIGQRIKRRARRTKMTPGVVTFYWGVRGRPRGLGHHTIFLPADFRGAFDDLFKHKRVPRDLPFYVSVPSATDATLAPAGDSCVFVLAPVPLLSQMQGADWREVAREIKTRVLETLAQRGVQIEASDIYVEEIYTPDVWRRRFGLYDGSAFGAAHTLSQIGPFRRKNFSEEFAGLYYTGASTTPGTGMPMVVLSGRLTAERILSREC